MTCALATLKAGGAYLPLDPAYPVERLAFMLDDAQPSVLITSSKMAKQLPLGPWRVIAIDQDTSVIDRQNLDAPDIDIAPETLDAMVPNLILQPIVENAIRHGIISRIAPGRIEIRASRTERSLRLAVKDNGPGLGSQQDSSGRLRTPDCLRILSIAALMFLMINY